MILLVGFFKLFFPGFVKCSQMKLMVLQIQLSVLRAALKRTTAERRPRS